MSLFKSGLFCSKPFKWFEVFQGDEIGDIYLCCPGWLDRRIGNIQNVTVEEIWNGKEAQEIRQSILDGSFRFCSYSRCPYLQTVSPPVERIEEVTDPELKTVIAEKLTLLPYGPRAVNCSFDRSCNLACPSCRTKVIIEHERREQIMEVRRRIQEEALRDAHLLYITGLGDPFGSPFYRKWLQTMKREDLPNLRLIFLHTNGQLWTTAIWNTLSEEIRELITCTEISIDAATPETYSKNRRGGSFERLLENLGFISSLRRHGPLNSVTISMVVQENNFSEMPEFVHMGQRFGFDRVFFSRLINWGTFTGQEFKDRAVHLSEHPRYPEFMALLERDIFRDPIVHLGNLAEFTHH
jgi:sulfatase maturation enzyme AslB (radical SAM superfamily)